MSVYIALLVLSAAAAANDHNPFAGDPKAAKAGESEFRINCALCHGLGARGGGRGPDLTRAQKKHAHSDAELFQIIANGIPGTAMPANGTNGQGVGMMDEEMWQIITYIHSVEVKAPEKPIGSPAHGKDLFYGDASCSLCHMVEGKGGRVGPDLTGRGRIAHASGDHRFRAQSKPAPGLGIDRGDERVSPGIRDHHRRNRRRKGNQRRGLERGQLQRADDGHDRENLSARKRQTAFLSEESRIDHAYLHP